MPHWPMRPESKRDAKEALGTTGGKREIPSWHPLFRKFRKHDEQKKMMLSVPMTPRDERREGPRNRFAEEREEQERQEVEQELREADAEDQGGKDNPFVGEGRALVRLHHDEERRTHPIFHTIRYRRMQAQYPDPTKGERN